MDRTAARLKHPGAVVTAPYLGAVILVNVATAHNNGSPVAPGVITAVLPSGRVNARVLYDGPTAAHLASRHRPEWLEDIAFHDTTDPVVANRHGLYGAFWPDGPDVSTILENQEKIMAAQDDINAAVSAVQAVTADLTSAAANIQAEIAALNAQITAAGGTAVDTTQLDAVIAPLQAAQAAVDALETSAAPATPPAS